MESGRVSSPRGALRRLSQLSFAQKPDMSQEKASQAKQPPFKLRGLLGFFYNSNSSKASSDASDTSNPEATSENMAAPSKSNKPKKKFTGRLRTDMIKRVEGGGVGLVNPMGWYQNGTSPLRRLSADPEVATAMMKGDINSSPEGLKTPPIIVHQDAPMAMTGILDHSMSQSAPANIENGQSSAVDAHMPRQPTLKHASYGHRSSTSTDRSSSDEIRTSHLSNEPQIAPTLEFDDPFPRSKTIAFNDQDEESRQGQRNALTTARETHYAHNAPGVGGGFLPRTGTIRPIQSSAYGLERTATGRRSMGARTLNPSTTQSSGLYPRTYTMGTRQESIMMRGYGGFPTPIELLRRLIKRFFPKLHRSVNRTMSMSRTNTIASGHGGTIGGLSGDGAKEAPYITFDALVGRNSHFHELTSEQYDELGGVEYRALKTLFWIVLAYYVGIQLTGFIIMGPYTAAGGRYDSVFDNQYRIVPTYWFAAFQSVSAFSNTGFSLVDESMIPFQEAYVMVFAIILLIFAGNTAFPIFLRFSVWWIHKIVPTGSRIKENLQFILDHPRRCFIYMFPSTQTWFLAFVMFCLTMFDFVSFLVLDIGNPVIEAIPVGTRITSALLQSAAVRSSGFAIVPLNSLAPAVKVLYVIMMYIAVYPIAMSVRSTNVYEERSLGVFEGEEEEPDGTTGGDAVVKYLGWHARRQLAFDIWWLALGLWLVCIIERGPLNVEADASWFSIFSILFELVSAYATVGLSLGVPYNNFSLSGSFRKLSKLVVIAVMIRGRHRGLPVAIDRAVMLPKDFTHAEVVAFDEERLARRQSRQPSLGALSRSISHRPTGSSSSPPTQHRPLSKDWSEPHNELTRTESPSQMNDNHLAGRSTSNADTGEPKSPTISAFPRSLSTVREATMTREPSLQEEAAKGKEGNTEHRTS